MSLCVLEENVSSPVWSIEANTNFTFYLYGCHFSINYNTRSDLGI